MAKRTTYPDQTFENAARKRGADVQCLWQMPGPKKTGVAWIECLSVNSAVVLVETFVGGGWACRSIAVDESVNDALDRCGLSSASLPSTQGAA